MSEQTRAASRILVIIALAAIVGIGVYYASRRAPLDLPSAKPHAAEEAPLPPRQAAQRSEPAISAPAEITPTPTVPAVAPPRPSGPDLTGNWELLLIQDDGSEQTELRITIKHDGATLRVIDQKPPIDIALESGLRVRLSRVFDAAFSQSFNGQFDPAYTEATGTVTIIDHGQTYESGARIRRVSDEQLRQEEDSEELLEWAVLQSRALMKALLQYAADHNGAFPSTLNQIPAESLGEFAPDRLRRDVKVTYYGAGVSIAKSSVPPSQAQDFKQIATPEALLEHERQLREVWGAMPGGRQAIVVRIEFENTPLVISGFDTGDIETIDTSPNDREESAVNELRMSEMNNMKQLGLVLKMFANENKEQRFPGGWLTIYPEYLVDLRVLHSPWVSEGEPSYELLFPAATERELFELYQRVRDSDAPTAYESMTPNEIAEAYSNVPLVTSREIMPAEEGKPESRAVLFLDGHVQAVPLSDWNSVVTPFLR